MRGWEIVYWIWAPRAKVSLKVEIEGEKKYSPPRGTTQMGRSNDSLCKLGLVPDIERVLLGSVGFICPMIGSIPGSGAGFRGGNVLVFDQPITATVRDWSKKEKKSYSSGRIGIRRSGHSGNRRKVILDRDESCYRVLQAV